MPNFRTGLLLIRAWVERGSSAPLRAKIRVTKDLSNGIEKTTTVTSPEAGGRIVEDWLQEVLVADKLEADGSELK
jgi:hypothetical protein